MATYPRDQTKLAAWARSHADVWSQDPSAIGLTPAQVAAFNGVVDEFEARRLEAITARNAARSATAMSNHAKLVMRNAASDLVRTIRAFAAMNGASDVLARAQLPIIAQASPVPPPGQPTNLSFSIGSDGALTLAWTAKHPKGSDRVVYLVRRKLAHEKGYTFLGASGEKSYTDDTLPVGVASATYVITAQRGRVKGPDSLTYVVTFGSVAPPLDAGTVAAVQRAPRAA